MCNIHMEHVFLYIFVHIAIKGIIHIGVKMKSWYIELTHKDQTRLV